MKLKIEYGNGVLALPARLFPDQMPPDSTYLYVLFALCANPALCTADTEDQIPAVAAVCRLPEATVQNAVSYWLQAGLLSAEEVQTDAAVQQERPKRTASSSASAAKETEKPVPAKKQPRPAMPSYTQAELADIQKRHPDLRPAIDSCAQIAGKLFSEHECAQLTALYDCYGLDSAYLITLFAYCKNTLGKTAVSYVVRTALGLYDDGVRTMTELDAKIKYREKLTDLSFQVRKMFGLGDRALTSREKSYIDNWVQWSMPLEVIRCAYEITIKNIEKPSMAYVDKILSKWNESGIRTIEDVQAAESAYAKQKQKEAPQSPDGEHSFDLDEFLSLAMKRSFT